MTLYFSKNSNLLYVSFMFSFPKTIIFLPISASFCLSAFVPVAGVFRAVSGCEVHVCRVAVVHVYDWSCWPQSLPRCGHGSGGCTKCNGGHGCRPCLTDCSGTRELPRRSRVSLMMPPTFDSSIRRMMHAGLLYHLFFPIPIYI